MQAVILAAGEGSRLRPLTRSKPKAMLPVANRPIIEYVIDALLENGIRDIVVVVGYRKEDVIRHLNRLDAPIQVVVQERQLGTADALRVRIVRTGTIRDGLEVEWVQLQARRTPPDTVVGVAKLPHGRAITIHVRTPGDQLLAMKLFKTLVDGVVYAPQEQLARGAELVGRMQAAGLTQLVQDMGGFEGEQTYYVRDSFDQPRGFVIMQFGRNDTAGEWWKLKGDRVHYLAETRGGLSRSHIESGNALERYIWFTQRTRGRRSAGGESDIRLDADGNLLISGSVQMGDIRCRPALTVPEMLIAQAARVFLDGPTEETVINVLFDRGSIVPAAVTAPDATRDEENYWRAPHCVRFEYLHAADNETRL